MKKVTAMFLALVMLLGLSACGGNTQKTGAEARKDANEIVVGIAQDLSSSLSPYQLSSAGTREIMFNVFEGLYKTDSTGDFKPALATDYTVSSDGLTYTFTLRDGVKFHNGATVTAHDVIYSYETCAKNSVDSAIKGVLANVTSVTADGNKIVIKLEKPNNDFLAYVGSVYISPAAYTDQDTKPVGTGPFRFVSRTVQDNVVLQRYEGYWGEKAKIAKITCKIYEENTALLTALDGGSVDLVAHLSSDQVKGLESRYNVLEGTMNLVQALYLNNDYKPLSDIRVRQALCYAVDVDAMLKLTADGHGSKLGSSIYPSFTKYFDASLVDAYPYDAAKAKELLSQAGYGSGFDLVITVPSNYSPHVNAGMALAEQLKAVGINATVQEVDWNTWLTDVYQGRKYQATVCGFDASTLTANALLGRYESTSPKNMCNYKSEVFDSYMQQANSTTDDAARTQAFRAAAKCLSDDAVNVYLQDLADFVAVSKNLSGYQFYPIYVIDFSKLSW